MSPSRNGEPTVYWAEHAWVGGVNTKPSLASSVTITVSDGRIESIRTDVIDIPRGAITLAGLTLPGLANTHSHAFHRLLRAAEPVNSTGADSFWSWRDDMYRAANELTPDSYGQLATDVFTEMLQAGYTAVGEFHYVHHEPDGRPYDTAHAMELALVEAAQTAGIRITLLDTCYLRSGFGETTVNDEQRRFSDGTVAEWEARVESLGRALRGRSSVRPGAAIHSMRAVHPNDAAVVVRWARTRSLPLHVHISEQPEENRQAMAHHNKTPTELLTQAGAELLRQSPLCAVHATHLSENDVHTYGQIGAYISCCPTTERVLADGISPTGALVASGAKLCVGSDSQSVIDPFEELRGVEMHQRLLTGRRGTHTPAALLEAGSVNGYRCLGWDRGGAIEPGMLADFVSLDTASDRLAGIDDVLLASAAVLAATASDVHNVVVNGAVIVRDGVSVRRPSRYRSDPSRER
jgi:formiminoglutamate deiminase